MDSSSITERLNHLSPAKRELLERRLKEKNNGALAARSILRRAAREFAPLSFAQQRLWFLNQLEPDSPAYNESTAVRLSGLLDVDSLEKAFNRIIARHEVLRTTIVPVDGNSMQRVADRRSIEVPLIDLRGQATQDRESEARRLINETIRRPFDLSRDLMLRVLLLRLGDQEHILLLVRHHIASDGWSSGIFWQELTALYEAYTSDRLPQLRKLPVQYGDYAAWQREWLRGEILETQLSYWRKQLENIATLQLPTDRPRPAIQSFQGAKQTWSLGKDLSEALKALSRKEGVTLFMTLLAAFRTLLYRYTGQEDIAVGTPIAGRNRAEIEGLIGFFVNTLVLRTDVSGKLTFNQLLERVRGVCLDAYSHQDLPFEKLVEELQPHRNLSHNPLFQVAFQLNNVPRPLLKLPAIHVEEMELDGGIAKFDLSLSMSDRGEGIAGRLQYNTDLFDEATITRMLGHFQILLEGIVADPDQRICDFPILSETERRQLLVEWNGTKRDHPKDKCVHQLFEEQARRTPEAVAVVFEDQQLSYRELNQRANRIARRLQRLGVGADILVGLCVERSVELVLGILAILKAGGAYVPLDPSYPNDRLEFMLKDSDVSVLLTQKHVAVNLPAHEAVVVYLDVEHLDAFSAEPLGDANLESHANPDSLAYVIYTSGSTGKPKGALITHYNVVRLFQSTKEWFDFESSDVWSLFHSYAFDFSVWEIWGALLNGGRLVVVPHAISRSPEDFAALVKQNGVTVLNQTPSAFRHLIPYLISTLPPERSALRWVIFGGEALELASLQPWFDCYGDQPAQLINMYGITETTVHVTYRPITQADIELKVGSVVGRPIPDLKVYVLDAHQQLQPPGIPGEIYVGGAGVANGYLHRPELTAARFVADSFSGDPRAKLYRSGDLARWLPNGELEYLGRIDDQVKIRGYRIELGEIETALSRHVQVREAMVLAREDTPGDKRLVAYVVAGDELAMEELRSSLNAVLPDYMVPSAFVRLHSFPLTSNGKIDRAALPSPDQTRREFGQRYVGPRTEIESTLCELFGAVLRVDKVSIHDNFFELGGHSLLATQVMARIRGVLSVELPLRRLFEYPTVYGLATIISAERQTLRTGRLPPIRPASRSGDVPLSFAQQRLWFFDQLEPESSAYNVHGAWRLNGPLDVMALQRSVNEIVRRHEVLRTTFVTVDGEAVQQIKPSMALSPNLINLSELAKSEREFALGSYVKEEFRAPFDLARGPLLRVSLLKLANDDHVLLLIMHHIVSDGWSVGVLFRELSQLYEAFAAGNASPLENLPIQYADYAVWQRGWLQGDVLEAQLVYWRRQLENLTVLQLPTDRQRPTVQRYRGAKARINFDTTLTKKLWALSRGENATLYITLLAAFQILLSRYSGQEDIAVGSPIAGRSMPELEGLIGFFANTLVLRGDLSGNPSFREFLHRMRNVALDAYTHQDLPFEKLVEDLRPRRDLNISPLFQVMFVLQNDPREDLKLKDLAVSSVSINSETAKFDLLLSLRENKFGLVGTLEYDTDLFDSTTIERMLGQFETLLNGIVANPDQRLQRLPLLTDAQRHQLLVQWNDTTKPYPRHLCVHQLFEKQAERGPDRIAVIFEDRQMTYRDLDVQSNQLAHYLRKHGVGTKSLVGVCFERSMEMIVALVAVLKAGGAYLPLDPSYPPERLGLMVEQAGASILLTQKSLVSRLPALEAACHCLDSLDQFLAQEKRERLGHTPSPEDAAYVLFTSGSTGVPKGVLMEHRPLVNLLSWQAETLACPAGARTLQFAPLSFDVSFQEIFSALCSGGTLVMIGEEERRDPKVLLNRLKEKAVERLFLPFIALQQLADAAQDDAVAIESLREIITAGEQLQATQPIADLFARLPNCRLYNQYGPTESHVVTSFALGSDPADWPSLPPIGRPIGNSKIYILDGCLQPVPVGVTGELYIGGDSLARGYLHQRELSQEKFIANPFDKEAGARLYRTGDLARYLADGQIQFVGRIDQQVKIRGYRIELGEIEAVLGQHPAVREAVALAREDSPGDRRVVAYVVSPPDTSTNELQSFLKQKLPEFMVPSAFVFLDSLPLTPNGKIDRNALPAPDQSRPEMEEHYIAPRTPIEELLAEIWADVLKMERVGIRDNFFDLGGHSLLATQVVSRIRETLQVDLPLRALFEAPTIAELALRIEPTAAETDKLQELNRHLGEVELLSEAETERLVKED